MHPRKTIFPLSRRSDGSSRGRGLQRALLLAVVPLLLAGVCRRGVTPFPPSAPHRAPWGLSREFLLPETTSKIVFVVIVSQGRDPMPPALDALVRIASKYGERPAAWVLSSDRSDPAVAWEDAPPATGFFGRITCPGGSLDPATSYVFVRYVGSSGDDFGRAGHVLAAPECGQDWFRAIEIAQGLGDRRRILWLTRRQIEERTLLHEYGHVLGLGSNPAHGYWPGVLPYSGGAHCVNPSCAVVLPDARTIAYGVYRTGLTFRQVHDYCKDCRSGIEQAKRHWRTGEEFPASERLPQPDASAAIARLTEPDFTEHGSAVQFISVGKAAVPGLIERLRTLPGGDEGSPRAIADWIVKTIVAREAGTRSGRRAAWMPGDTSGKLLEWWSREQDRFLAGDEWEIPEDVIVLLDPEDLPASPSDPEPNER